MAAITQFEQSRITEIAALHDEAAALMTSQLNRLENEVNALLGPSNSGMTRALRNAYDAWFAGVESRITARTRELTAAMTTVARQQDETDEVSASNVQSSIGSYLLG